MKLSILLLLTVLVLTALSVEAFLPFAKETVRRAVQSEIGTHLVAETKKVFKAGLEASQNQQQAINQGTPALQACGEQGPTCGAYL